MKPDFINIVPVFSLPLQSLSRQCETSSLFILNLTIDANNLLTRLQRNQDSHETELYTTICTPFMPQAHAWAGVNMWGIFSLMVLSLIKEVWEVEQLWEL